MNDGQVEQLLREAQEMIEVDRKLKMKLRKSLAKKPKADRSLCWLYSLAAAVVIVKILDGKMPEIHRTGNRVI